LLQPAWVRPPARRAAIAARWMIRFVEFIGAFS
jgi:hypothetical protein